MKFTKLVLAAALVALTAPAMAQVDAKVTGRVHFDTPVPRALLNHIQ